jgi:hypothetical protein
MPKRRRVSANEVIVRETNVPFLSLVLSSDDNHSFPLAKYTEVPYTERVTRFEWDPKKNKANQLKHGFSFEVASGIFQDPNHFTVFDRIVEDETRWLAFGSLRDSLACLTVVHTYTEQAGTVRIISARKATRKEREAYYAQKL